MDSFAYQYDHHKKAVDYALKQIQASSLAPYVTDVILFGSVARQTARFDSDVDLLLLLSDQAFLRPKFAKESRLLRVDVQTDDYRDAEIDLRIEQDSYFQTSTQTIDVFIKEEGVSIWKID